MSLLGHLPSNPYILWHKGNLIGSEVEGYGKNLLAKTFGRDEVLKIIGFIDDFGFAAGSLGYIVSTIVFAIVDAQVILEDLAFDTSLTDELRENAMFLLIHYAQFHSVDFCIEAINRYVAAFSSTEDRELFISMKETLESKGFLGYVGT